MTKAVNHKAAISERRRLPSRLLVVGPKQRVCGDIGTILKAIIPATAEGSASGYFSGRLVFAQSASDVADLDRWLESSPARELLIFVESFESAIERALVDRRDMRELADDWYETTNDLLALSDRLGDRAVTFVVEDVVSDPEWLAENLSDRYGDKFLYSGARVEEGGSGWEDIYRLLAASYVAEHPEVAELIDRSRRSSVAKGVRPSRYSDYSRAIQHLQQVQDENVELLGYVHRLQSLYEAKILEVERKEDALAEHKGQIDTLQSYLAADRDTVQALRRALTRQEEKLERIRCSTSWRLTGPLRVTIRALRKLVGR